MNRPRRVWPFYDQNRNFTASCTTRGSSAAVIVPKLAAPATAAGAPNAGVLSRLNTSARTSTDRLAPAGMRRINAKSTLRYDGPRTGLRDAEPIVNCGAMANADVLNQCAGVRSPAGSSGSPTRFGRCTPKPANALKFVVCVTATGTPDSSVTIDVNVQPRQSHTTDDTNTCGMSPVE